ncbi:unnamed protein product, partial [Hapterophycus canaliculatus]
NVAWHGTVLQPGDTSDGLEIAGPDALVLNGSTIRREDGDIGTGRLYGFSLRGSSSSLGADLLPVVVDCSDIPVVLNLTSTAFAGEYGAGQRIYFQVTFSGDVIVDENGSPQLLLETGAENNAATFYTGNETSVLTFRSTIK